MNTMIVGSFGGAWEIRIANVDGDAGAVAFSGGTEEATLANARLFAQYAGDGINALAAHVGDLVEGLPANVDPAAFVTDMFQNVDTIECMGQVIATLEEGVELGEFVTIAGEALLDALMVA